jgi:hypothetical protein
MYTSTYKLRSYADQNKQDWVYTSAALPHKGDAPLAQRGHSGSLTLNFEDPLSPQDQPDYDVTYTFNRATDTYTRYMGGAPHIDSNTGKVLTPSNVIVIKTANGVADPSAGITPGSILIPTVGSGMAIYFRDGKVLQGHWQQKNENAPLRFLDGRWGPVAFNPGQTWIEVAPVTSPATWQFH